MDPFEHNFKLPHSYVTIDTIEFRNSTKDVIDILQNIDDYYALFSEKSAIGPFKSKEDLLKHVILAMSKNSEGLVKAFNQIEDAITGLYHDRMPRN